MSDIPQYDSESREYGSKLPVASLTARIVTLASLIVSVIVLKTSDGRFNNGGLLNYKRFTSYKYMFYVSIFGIGYTLLQLPFAIYFMRKKKHLINSFGYLKFDFYADKMVVFLLTTAAGAAFGATMDLKKIELYDEDNETTYQNFLTMAYIPSTFLLVGGIATTISSVHSSLALTKI